MPEIKEITLLNNKKITFKLESIRFKQFKFNKFKREKSNTNTKFRFISSLVDKLLEVNRIDSKDYSDNFKAISMYIYRKLNSITNVMEENNLILSDGARGYLDSSFATLLFYSSKYLSIDEFRNVYMIIYDLLDIREKFNLEVNKFYGGTYLERRTDFDTWYDLSYTYYHLMDRFGKEGYTFFYNLFNPKIIDDMSPIYWYSKLKLVHDTILSQSEILKDVESKRFVIKYYSKKLYDLIEKDTHPVITLEFFGYLYENISKRYFNFSQIKSMDRALKSVLFITKMFESFKMTSVYGDLLGCLMEKYHIRFVSEFYIPILESLAKDYRKVAKTLYMFYSTLLNYYNYSLSGVPTIHYKLIAKIIEDVSRYFSLFKKSNDLIYGSSDRFNTKDKMLFIIDTTRKILDDISQNPKTILDRDTRYRIYKEIDDIVSNPHYLYKSKDMSDEKTRND